MKIIAVALLVMISAVPLTARASPTVRRLYLLCNMEDPSCGLLLLQAEAQFKANPTWTFCIAGPDAPSRQCPLGGTPETAVCKPTRALSLRWLYIWFMRIVPTESLIWEDPARIGVYEAFHNANACVSSRLR